MKGAGAPVPKRVVQGVEGRIALFFARRATRTDRWHISHHQAGHKHQRLTILNLMFTLMILATGIVIYLDYQEYKPNVTSKEDIANIVQEVDKYTDIKQLKVKYINHLNKNFENHQVVNSIIEFVIYIFVGMGVFLLLSVIALSRMELRR